MVVTAEVGVGIVDDQVRVRIRPLALPVLTKLTIDGLAHIAPVVCTSRMLVAAGITVEAVIPVPRARGLVALAIALAIVDPLNRARAHAQAGARVFVHLPRRRRPALVFSVAKRAPIAWPVVAGERARPDESGDVIRLGDAVPASCTWVPVPISAREVPRLTIPNADLPEIGVILAWRRCRRSTLERRCKFWKSAGCG